jgi:transposase-like protein
VLRARIVLAAAQGGENKQMAECLGIAPNTALRWRKRFFPKAGVVLDLYQRRFAASGWGQTSS